MHIKYNTTVWSSQEIIHINFQIDSVNKRLTPTFHLEIPM